MTVCFWAVSGWWPRRSRPYPSPGDEVVLRLHLHQIVALVGAGACSRVDNSVPALPTATVSQSEMVSYLLLVPLR